jgi:hypothetical protein
MSYFCHPLLASADHETVLFLADFVHFFSCYEKNHSTFSSNGFTGFSKCTNEG